MTYLTDLGFAPLNHIELPPTNEYLVALIRSRFCIFVSTTKEVIVFDDAYILADAEIAEEDNDIFRFNNTVSEEIDIPLCGYLLDECADCGTVALNIGGNDERKTSSFIEYAVVSYIIPQRKLEPEYHGSCEEIIKRFTLGDKS